jgi:hypothetical protein
VTDRIRFVLADARSLPWPAQSFDTVVSQVPGTATDTKPACGLPAIDLQHSRGKLLAYE